MKNVLPIFIWAKAHGEAKIIDRILVKVLPQLIKNDCKITAHQIDSAQEIEVPVNLYEEIKQVAESLIGKEYTS